MQTHPGQPPSESKMLDLGSWKYGACTTDITRGNTSYFLNPKSYFHHASVAQCIEHRASNAKVAGEIPAGSTTSFPWNVNRTSEPGLTANEFVVHTRDEEHALRVPPISAMPVNAKSRAPGPSNQS